MERLSPFYTDEVAGKKYEQDVEGRVIDGLEITATDDMPILWADPKSPAHVEKHGPGFWALALIGVGLAAADIFHYS